MSDKNFEIIRQIASKLGVASSESNDDIYNPLYLNSISRSVDRLFSQLQASQARIKDLEQAQEWISVDDRLPKDYTPVLIFNGSELAHANRKEGKWWIMNSYRDIYIDSSLPTHWLPLPTTENIS
jgi:hypothetical protein